MNYLINPLKLSVMFSFFKIFSYVHRKTLALLVIIEEKNPKSVTLTITPSSSDQSKSLDVLAYVKRK